MELFYACVPSAENNDFARVLTYTDLKEIRAFDRKVMREYCKAGPGVEAHGETDSRPGG